ncbi:hypothetical protein L4C33_07155, partial [Vibrio makurazakiensis]|uniref:HEAT repeat domain-containing protein n=1 Tax=Vibrio makurazakiensis TaxID=2910250 RepID=UPI003D0CE5C5
MFKNKLKISAILIASALTVSTTALANGSELSPDSRSIDSPDKGVAASTSQVQDTQSRISQLSYIAQDQNQSVASRANALQELRTFPSQNALVAVARGLKDKNSEIREAAIIGSEPYQLDHRWKMVSPLLEDPEVMVRHTAASNLVRDYNSVTESQKQQLDAPVKELIAFLEGQSTEEYQLLFADVLRWYNQWAQAETVYVELLKHRQEVPQVWLSYADNFRAQGKDNLAVETLDRAIEIMPDNSALHY